jgi:broad specificity phosphatase PhoE
MSRNLFTTFHGKHDFYFLRHGKSEGNRLGVVQGRSDYDLAPKGVQQAEAAARWFRDRGVETVLASPLLRAFRTAEVVAEAIGRGPVVREALLVELDTGVFTDTSLSTVRREQPDLWRRFQSESWDAVPQAESSEALYRRALSFWEAAAARAAETAGALLSVTHAGFLQWIIKATTGDTRWMPLYPTSNCGVYHFTVRADDSPRPAGVLGPYVSRWELIDYRVVATPEG